MEFPSSPKLLLYVTPWWCRGVRKIPGLCLVTLIIGVCYLFLCLCRFVQVRSLDNTVVRLSRQKRRCREAAGLTSGVAPPKSRAKNTDQRLVWKQLWKRTVKSDCSIIREERIGNMCTSYRYDTYETRREFSHETFSGAKTQRQRQSKKPRGATQRRWWAGHRSSAKRKMTDNSAALTEDFI